MAYDTTHQSHSPPDRMTRREAAEYLGVRQQTLGAWAATGRYGLRYIRVGRIVYYLRADLDAWLASRTATSAAAHRAQLVTA